MPAWAEAYDEIVSAGIKRKHGLEHILGALLTAQIEDKRARSIRYQMGIAKLPLAKEIADLTFDGTPINVDLVHDLASGAFLDSQRNAVLVGGTGTGKSHIAIGITLSMHPGGQKGALLQRYRSRQQAGERSKTWSPGAHRRPAHAR